MNRKWYRVYEIDHRGVKLYVEQITEDVYPGKTYPPRGGIHSTPDKSIALMFFRKSLAVEISKMLGCSCGACKPGVVETIDYE